jgi:hypothetical protein
MASPPHLPSNAAPSAVTFFQPGQRRPATIPPALLSVPSAFQVDEICNGGLLPLLGDNANVSSAALRWRRERAAVWCGNVMGSAAIWLDDDARRHGGPGLARALWAAVPRGTTGHD